METANKRTGLFWILFLLSVVAFFAVYFYPPTRAYVSLVLPFNVTFFAKAMDIM